jgi:predicted nucleotidyltransferase component of viral defense system
MTTPHAKSVSERIKRVAREKGATYAEILTQFLIERAAVRLVSDPVLYTRLVFKGGFVGLRVYASPRFTTDLDAVIQNIDQYDFRRRAREAMAQDLGDHVWFDLEAEVDLVTQNEYGGVRLQFRSGLGAPPSDKRLAQVINLDIGTGDPITPGAHDAKTPMTLGDGELSWRVYPIETIIAEKLHPLVNLGAENSRSKDIFDLAFYLPNAKAELLKQAIARTFVHRGDAIPDSITSKIETMDHSLLRRGWRSAISAIRPSPDFDETIKLVIKWLRHHAT